MARCNAQQSDDHPWQDEQMNVMTAKDLSAAATQLGGEERAAQLWRSPFLRRDSARLAVFKL